MRTYTVFNRLTGKILMVLTTPLVGVLDRISNLGADEHYFILGNYDYAAFYIDQNDEPIKRPIHPAIIDTTTIAADGVEEATISNVVNGATVSINHVPQPSSVTDNKIIFTTDLVGEYKFKIQAFPYIDMEFTVHAN